MELKQGNVDSPKIVQLLQEHLNDMYAASPPESVHALNVSALQAPSISFWSLWDGEHLAGCGALKELDNASGEIKSMRTAHGFRRKGIASHMLQHIIESAQKRGYRTLYLETGTVDFFMPAIELYKTFGFEVCGPFADYSLDPYSLFMKKDLSLL